MTMPDMAWPRQPTDRQWIKPEGDDPRTLYQMLMVSQEKFGDNPCFGYIPNPGMPRMHISYNEFGELATSVAKGLRDIGVIKDDRVAIIADNSVEWLLYLMEQTHWEQHIQQCIHTNTAKIGLLS